MTRRSGRAVECTGLENRHTREGIGGSNPSSSAKTKQTKLSERMAFFVYSNFPYSNNSNNKKSSPNWTALYFCGGGEIRTRVQRKHSRAFYMLIFRLNFRERGRYGNPPIRIPYLLNFILLSEHPIRLA